MEALAAASSVLAVVSVTVQLGSIVQKLIRFWDSVKDAPTDIADIKAHLRVLCALLRSIEIDLSRPTSFEDASLANDCLAVCRTSVGKLETVTSRLDVGLEPITIWRKWACLRKALSEKELEIYWRELERAKSMLLLYQGLRNGYATYTTCRPWLTWLGNGTIRHSSSSRVLRRQIAKSNAWDLAK